MEQKILKEEIVPSVSVGGYLSEYSGEIIRRSSLGYLTPLFINITRWNGIGKHYYVSVEREFDYILRLKENGEYCWWQPWDDPVGKGRYFNWYRFDSYTEALRRIKIMKRYARRFKMKAEVSDFSDSQYFYKEGD